MKIVYEYSHLGGSEILKVRYPEIEKEIYQVIGVIVAQRLKPSKEKTKIGQFLYSPIDMNAQFQKQFHEKDFSEMRDTYSIYGIIRMIL